MLLSMKSLTEASRALAYVVAAAHDKAFRHPDAAVRRQNMAFVELMILVVKGWSTEIGIDVASTGVQMHGGIGDMEEAGAAQHLRDARISAIYEGTTGIQANDLIGRKMARDGGTNFQTLICMMRNQGAELAKHDNGHLAAIRRRFAASFDALTKAGEWVVDNYSLDVRAVSASAVPFLMLFGVVAGAWQMAHAALVARSRIDAGDSDPFYSAKLITVRFFCRSSIVEG